MENLIADILLIILDNLKLTDLIKVKSVCQRWKKLISSNYQDEGNYKIDLIYHHACNKISIESSLMDSQFSVLFGNGFIEDREDIDILEQEVLDNFYSLIEEFNQNKTKMSKEVRIDYRAYKSGLEFFQIEESYLRFENSGDLENSFKIRIKKNEINIFLLLMKIYIIALEGNPDYGYLFDCRLTGNGRYR